MIGELLALGGATLVLLSAIGVVRLPDALARLHALAKASTLGVLLLLAGAAANLRDLNDLTSVALAAILHLLASPPASNMVSRATYLAEGLPDDAPDEHRAPPGETAWPPGGQPVGGPSSDTDVDTAGELGGGDERRR